MRYLASVLVLSIFPVSIFAQDPIRLRLQQKMDKQEAEQKSLVYSYQNVTYVNKLDKNGSVEKTDTIITWQKYQGESQLEQKLIYSSDKKAGKSGKRERSQSAKLPRLDDPEYDFRVDSLSGKIVFTPHKPKKGQLSGEVRYDPASLDLKGLTITMPKPKWPVDEFDMEMIFVKVEGFLFPGEFRMQAGWNAIVSQGRIRIESRNSDFITYK
jgi:hypothetical protein